MTGSNIHQVNSDYQVNSDDCNLLDIRICFMHSQRETAFFKGVGMKTSDYFDAARVKLNLPSDYALAKRLGVSAQAISQCRKGEMHLTDTLAVKLADMLGRDRLELLAVASLERAKTPEARAAWTELMRRIAEGFQSLLPHAKSGRRFALPR